MSKEETGIIVHMRFWTDYYDEKENKKNFKKKAWAAGTLYLRASKFHGIKADKSIPFNNLEELIMKLDELLKNNDVELIIKDEKGNLTPRLGKGYPKSTWSGKYD